MNGERLVPMETPESRQLAAVLAHRIEQGAKATQIAATIISVVQEIDTVLCPIIGNRGVAALYRRSLYLTGPAHPWLADTHESVQTIMNLEDVKSIFAQQSNTNLIAAGGSAFLQTFYELLSSLVGNSLTERIFRPVWSHSLSGPAAQDTAL